MKTNLLQISDQALLENTKCLADEERRINLELLKHLREIERRRLYAKLGFSSLFRYVVDELKFSESAAMRRISSMRLIRDLPAQEAARVEAKIESGELTLSVISQAHSVFDQEKKHFNQVRTPEEKAAIVNKVLSNCSSREAERKLATLSPDVARLPKEKIRVIDQQMTRVEFLATPEHMKLFEDIRAQVGHPGMGWLEVFEILAREFLKKKIRQDKNEKSSKKTKQDPTAILPKLEGEAKVQSGGHSRKSEKSLPTSVVQKAPSRRYISRFVRREVWMRDQGRCTYVSAQTQRLCGEKHRLEFEHLKPFSLGGEDSIENLTLRCRAHNLLAAYEVFGPGKIDSMIAAERRRKQAQPSMEIDSVLKL